MSLKESTMKGFFNPKVSAMYLQLGDNCGFIKMAKTKLQEGERYQKGMKCFDWDNALNFKISDEEADIILESIKAGKNKITLEHFPEGGKSYLNFEYNPQQRSIVLIVTVVKGDNKNTISYKTTTVTQTKAIFKWLQVVSYSSFIHEYMDKLVYNIMQNIEQLRQNRNQQRQ